MADKVLDLDTLVSRPTVAIDGTDYEMLSPGELTVLQSVRFARAARKIDALQQDLASEPSEELEAMVDALAREVLLDVPDEVFARLSGTQKIQVAEVFIALLLQGRLQSAGAIARATGTTLGVETALAGIGARPSPSSSGSSEETRTTGWMACLSRFFRLS